MPMRQQLSQLFGIMILILKEKFSSYFVQFSCHFVQMRHFGFCLTLILILLSVYLKNDHQNGVLACFVGVDGVVLGMELSVKGKCVKK